MKIKPLIGACAFTLAAGSLSLDAQNLNGTVNSAFYGSPVAIQTINTGFGNAAGGNDSAGGSELDAAYCRVLGGNFCRQFRWRIESLPQQQPR